MRIGRILGGAALGSYLALAACSGNSPGPDGASRCDVSVAACVSAPDGSGDASAGQGSSPKTSAGDADVGSPQGSDGSSSSVEAGGSTPMNPEPEAGLSQGPDASPSQAPDAGSASAEAGAAGQPFACTSSGTPTPFNCDSATQYCQDSEAGDVGTAACAPLPVGCSVPATCACILASPDSPCTADDIASGNCMCDDQSGQVTLVSGLLSA